MTKFNNLSNKIFLIPKLKFYPVHAISRKFWQETFALHKRLVIQSQRRPATLIAGIIQPVLWLILFGALFQNAPVGLFSVSDSYRHFLTPGIIVFTALTGALNAGLPLMFDREFGFFNRLVVAPLVSKLSIIAASALFIASITLFQTFLIIGTMTFVEQAISLHSLAIIIIILLLLTSGLTMLSISLTFLLPGHIELLALIFIINLPSLFASTALVPFSFMPMWLQVIASLNPLSYAIETIRYVYTVESWSLNVQVINTIWGIFSLKEIIALLGIFNVGMIILSIHCIKPKLQHFS